MNKQVASGMSVIVKTMSNMTVGFVMLYGVYSLSQSYVSAGNGFIGGMIVALAFVQLMLAYGKDAAVRQVPKAVILFFENRGAILFLSLSLLGFTLGYFFLNFLGNGEPYLFFSSGIIPMTNIAISLKVGTGVFVIFVAFILLRVEQEHRKNGSSNSRQ